MRSDALSFMKQSLTFKDTKPLRDLDIAMGEIVALQKQVDALSKRLEKSENKWDKLRGTLPYKVYRRFSRR